MLEVTQQVWGKSGLCPGLLVEAEALWGFDNLVHVESGESWSQELWVQILALPFTLAV